MRFAAGAKRFENWESNVAGRVALGEAVRYAKAIGLNHIETRVAKLADVLREALSDIKGVQVRDLGQTKCGIVTFTKEGRDPQFIEERLREKGINVSVALMTSARLDLEARNLSSLVRASVHYFNTEDEISRFVQAVKNI